MFLENSSFYFRFETELNNRLDFIHYHPELDVLEILEQLSNYQVTTISTIVSEPEKLVSGKTPKGVKYVDDGIPFLGAGNIKENETDLSNATQIPSIYHLTALLGSQLLKNDLLITMAGSIGVCSVYELEEEANINQALARLRVNTEEINPHFLSRYLNSYFGQLAFTKYSHTVLQPNINLEEIKLIKIIKPSISEQIKILEKLKPIENESKSLKSKSTKLQNEALNYLLEELELSVPVNPNYFFKTGAEKQTLTFNVFPEEANERINYLFFHPKHKALEELQSKYQTVTLESICEREITAGVQPEFIEDGEKVVLKTVDLKNRYIDYNNALRVSELFYNANKFAEVIKDDIIIAATGYVSMGKVNVFDNDEPALISGELLSFKVNSNYDPYFIAYFLRSHLGQIQIEKYWTGSSGQIHLYDKDVRKFILPSYKSIPKKRQEEIAKAIRKKIEEAILLEQQGNEKQAEARKLFESLVLKEIK